MLPGNYGASRLRPLATALVGKNVPPYHIDLLEKLKEFGAYYVIQSHTVRWNKSLVFESV